MKLAIAATLVFTLGACASVRTYETKLDHWVGKDSEALVAKWGTPNRVHTFADGHKMYEYLFGDSHKGEKQGRATAGQDVGCKTFFFVDHDGVIRSWKWEGDDCVAK
jgi:hypothetical protein